MKKMGFALRKHVMSSEQARSAAKSAGRPRGRWSNGSSHLGRDAITEITKLVLTMRDE